ncbi:energy transducer TonB [Aureivirga sp. CE67]|uniref:energy transducer TonB n=1 Tax=Aureivirga sp. CE67 TaxID=1788983 RepID=UPI0018CB5962|nr:energy transducer TonB [Aureivirga sp. CE67]
MEVKKNPKANLQNYTKLFMQLGLVLSLVVVYLAIEHKTYEKTYSELADSVLQAEDEEDIPITEREFEVKPPPPPPPPPAAPEVIEIVEDDEEIEETEFEDTEADENEAVEVEEIVEEEEEEEVIEDVPFAIIEEVPVFPGCKGNKAELKKCLQTKIQKHVAKKFNADLANELGLPPGKKKIIVQFKIDNKGNITEVRSRAPHKRLQQEAERVIRSLPKMTPGKQRGRAVGVKYGLPISFNVE